MAEIEIHVDSYKQDVLDALEEKIPVALEECGLAGERFAKRRCPEDTGNLRNSITHTVQENAAYIGTNVEYAAYVEMGTKRTVAQPYIKPALEEHIGTYKAILEKWLST